MSDIELASVKEEISEKFLGYSLNQWCVLKSSQINQEENPNQNMMFSEIYKNGSNQEARPVHDMCEWMREWERYGST